MGDTDTPDFNKARGYLLGFSSVVLSLWYFGADLSSFKLLGNEIHLKENIQNVWMILAGINLYFWIRLYQRTPKGSLSFDMPMQELYEAELIKVAKRLNKRKIEAQALKAINESPPTIPGEIKLIRVSPLGKMTHYLNMTAAQKQSEDKLARIRDLTHKHRNEIVFISTIHYEINQSSHMLHGGHKFLTTPSKPTTRLVKTYAFIKGAISSPWFFDHVTPFLLGGISIGVALFSWFQINYPHA